MGTEAVKRDLGEILAHGEPERGMGQGEAAEQPTDAAGVRDRRGSPGAPERARDAATAAARRGGRQLRAGQRRRASSTSAASDPTPPDPSCHRMSDSWSPARRDPRRRTPPTAADLAARIPVPVRLPERYDGEPLRHLSPSSYSLLGQLPGGVAPALHQGREAAAVRRRCSSAAASMTRCRPITGGSSSTATGSRSTSCSTSTASNGTPSSRPSARQQGIDWHEDLTERTAFELGRQAIELAMAELVPHLGDPVDVQRRLEFTLAPGLEWTVLCYLDLETLKERAGEEPIAGGRRLQGQGQPDRPGPGRLGPTGRAVPRRSVARGPPGERAAASRRSPSPASAASRWQPSLVGTTRTTGQLRGVLARVALAASQIAAAYERYGPDQAVGVRRPDELEVQPALLPRLAGVSRRPRALNTRYDDSPLRSADDRLAQKTSPTSSTPASSAGRWRPTTCCRGSGGCGGSSCGPTCARSASATASGRAHGLVGGPVAGRGAGRARRLGRALRLPANGMTRPASSRCSTTLNGSRRCSATAASRFIPSATGWRSRAS